MGRSTLEPLDVALRHGRKYQLVRRLFLGLCVALTFGLPLWHLHLFGLEGGAPPLVGAPSSFRLFGLELVDPMLALGVALSRGIDSKWVWTALPGALLVVALGRFFCGWACPYLPILAVSNAARWLLAKLGARPVDLKIPRVTGRVVLVGGLVASSFLGVQLLPLFYPPAVIGRVVFSAVFFGAFGAGALVVGLAFCFDTFVSRAGFCRSMCPGGAMFSIVGAIAPLRLKREKSKCTDCTACDIVCNLGQLPMTDKVDSGCERCGRCVASCPTQALSWGLVRERP